MIFLTAVVQFQLCLVQLLLGKYDIEQWINFHITCLVYIPYLGKL